ncbi:MAG TPA: hypothetical protein PKD86_11295 [Gemmatales bacterium]|nr:hypothetical protein [Gemmatales bacterium]
MVGPNVWNFQDTVDQLLERDALVQVKDATDWRTQTLRLLGDAAARQELGNRAAAFVQSQQGAADTTLDLIRGLLKTRSFVLEAEAADAAVAADDLQRQAG